MSEYSDPRKNGLEEIYRKREEEILSTVVGFDLDQPQQQKGTNVSYRVAQVTFREFLAKYSEGTSARWEIYSRMKEEFEKLDHNRKARFSPSHQFTESLAMGALKRETLRNSMELLVRHYISKGNIENAPFFENL
jgi:hypothetical protein